MGIARDNRSSTTAAGMRRQAEERLCANTTELHPPWGVEETQRIVHELQVHQIELEMQNKELRQARDEVETALEKYTDLYDFAPVGYITLDCNGIVSAANLTAAGLLGIERSRLLGLCFGQFVVSTDRPAFTTLLDTVFSSQGREVCEVSLLSKGKSPLFMLIEALAVASGRECRLALSNITGRRQAEVALQESTERMYVLTEVSRAKSDFLANMSHELRTPLNSVIGFSEMLKEEWFGQLNAKQHEHVSNILYSGHHLLDLINDILDLSKVEAGKMMLEPFTVKLRGVIAGTLTMLQEKAIKHNLHLAMALPADGEIELVADERKLKQILFNLLSNAVKFTPDGGTIRVTARRISLSDLLATGTYIRGEKQPEAWDFMEISVTDSGIGIKQEDLPKLFKEFSQLDCSFTKEHEGTGLGLALTKRLVELHGGLVGVESEIGTGSRFFFAIPMKEQITSPRELKPA